MTNLKNFAEPFYPTAERLVADFGTFFCMWFFLQYLLSEWPDLKAYKMKVKTYNDFRNRQVSFLHGLTVLLLSAYQVYSKPSECGDDNNKFTYLTLTFSGSYFTYDLLSMWYYNLLENDMLVHHLLCIFGIL